jgi:hypothetical protein
VYKIIKGTIVERNNNDVREYELKLKKPLASRVM